MSAPLYRAAHAVGVAGYLAAGNDIREHRHGLRASPCSSVEKVVKESWRLLVLEGRDRPASFRWRENERPWITH